MMKLEARIKDLLYQYDCVIVPGFGGFICSFSPAKIHPVQHKFYPPGKIISFNQLLQINDGLLAHYTARSGKITYKEALEEICNEVKVWKSKLTSGERLSLNDIGTFFNDQGGNLQFSPSADINFLSESYGLKVFHSLPIKKEEQLKVVYKKETSESIITPGFDWNKMAKYSAAAAIISVVALSTFKLNLINDLNFNQISLNPFKTEVPSYKNIKYNSLKENDSFKIDEGLVGWESSSEKYFNYELDGKKLTVRLHEKIETERSDKVVVSAGQFHVVGGCFGVKLNAINFTKKLKKKGFMAHMPGLHKDLYIVSYQSFNTKKEAKNFLKKIQQEQNAQAWVLKK